MEVAVRLTAKDVNTDGVFEALEKLCLCFRPERNIIMTPPENKTGSEGQKPEQSAELPDGKAECTPTELAEPPKVVPIPAPVVPTRPTPIPAPATTEPPKPVPAVAPPQTAAPATPPVVPTAQPGFDRMQISQAAVRFAESSDEARQQVVGVINSFGVAALIEVPEERLGELATALRGIGVHI